MKENNENIMGIRTRRGARISWVNNLTNIAELKMEMRKIEEDTDRWQETMPQNNNNNSQVYRRRIQSGIIRTNV